jgi:hypothetical protein
MPRSRADQHEEEHEQRHEDEQGQAAIVDGHRNTSTTSSMSLGRHT